MSHEVLPYKVWVLNDNTIENIFVFNGKKETAFSKDDLDMLRDITPPIQYSPVQIHNDDSIMQIKKKIINEFGKESGVTYHELCMFAYVKKQIDAYAIFNETVLKSSNYLNRAKFTQLLHNTIDDFDNLEENKDVFTYDDFAKIIGTAKQLNMPIGLGMLPTSDHLFSPNPFSTVEYSHKNIVHTENTLLMNHGEIIDNNIFVCLAGDVFSALNEHSEFAAKTYYPLLATRSIFDFESLLEKHPQLVVETDKMMDRRHFNTYKIVDMFYDMSKIKSKLQYMENGIRKFSISMNPSHSFTMPLESIFKNIHTTPQYRFMKLNLGIRRENIYRLYSDKISKTGRKIPSLPRSVINSLSKNTGKQKQLSICVESTMVKNERLLIDIENNGAIVISGEFARGTGINALEDLLAKHVNPLLEDINGFLQNSGYTIPMIEKLTADNIEILSMEYVASIVLKKNKPIELKNMIGCLYSIFDIISDDMMKGAELRFKRVENYREMDQQALLITETFNKTGRESDVIDALIKNHNMTPAEAARRIAQHLKDVEYRNVDGNTIEIVENPGLPIKMNIKYADDLSNNGELSFYAENISHLGYIKTLSVYFESMMKILHDNKLCKQKNTEIQINETHILPPVIHERVSAFDFSPTSPVPDEEEKEEEVAKLSGNMKNLLDEYEDEADDFVGIDSSSDLDLTGVEIEGGGPDEEDEDEEGSESGSEENVSKPKKDRARNTNPFLLKLQKMDPEIILQGKDGRSNIYSRSCQSIRQPVVLTAEEKARIDRKSPGSYTKAMKFGSTPENEHYYICPRYWCSKTNTSVKDPSECDAEYLHEFKNPNNPIEHIDQKGEYIKHYPGFIKKPKLKHCMPCCFATKWDTWKKDAENKWKNQNETVKWDDKGRKWMREIKGKVKGDWIEQTDIADKERIDETGTVWKKVNGEWRADENEKERPRYAEKCDNDNVVDKKPPIGNLPIFNPDTREITPGRWGYLQYAVQHFMQIDYDKVVKPNNAAYLNDNVETLLRYGVEQTPNYSILGVIANALDKGIEVSKCGKYFADAVKLDDFAKYGNGSFTAIFRPTSIEIGKTTTLEDADGQTWTKTDGKWTTAKLDSEYPSKVKYMQINIDEYAETNTYKLMMTLSEEDQDTIWETMAAYEMYKLYLSNPETVVDYTYIWDLVSMLNAKLFKTGINLVIMEIVNNDVTDNIDLICPTNTYSKSKFDIDKPCLFLVKYLLQSKTIFEPIYSYNNGTRHIKRTFAKDSMKLLIKMLNHTLNNYCKPKSSMPDVYEFANPILLDELVDLVKGSRYKITFQVLNYQGKVIALQLLNNTTNKFVYVPCHPAAPFNIPTKYMDDVSLWSNSETTRNELKMLQEFSNGKIPCEPMLKLIEGPEIVGILTRSNQLVPINPPEQDVPGDNLKSLNVDRHMIQTDVTLTRHKNGDSEREITIRNARIESEMYALFRTTVKTLLAKPENNKYRDFIVNSTRSRKDNIREIVQKLVKLTNKVVSFVTMGENELEQMSAGYTCDKGIMSGILKQGCKLILPMNNILVPDRDNRLLYYYRIADELLRLKQYSNYILNSKQILNTGDANYKINADEFIVLETSLASDYYDNQKELPINQYMSGEIPYEMATAEKGQQYQNLVSLEDQEQNRDVDVFHNCIDKIHDIIGTRDDKFWRKKIFTTVKGKTPQEITFKSSIECSFGPLMKILSETDQRKYNDVDEIRQIIWEGYKDLVNDENNLDRILEILRNKQGKTELLKGVDDPEKFENAIINHDYFMTTLDLYVVAQKHGLPVILFPNKNTDNKLDDIGFVRGDWLILGLHSNKSSDNKFYFVRSNKKFTPSRMLDRSYSVKELNDMTDMIQSAMQDGDYRDHMISITNFLSQTGK